MQIRKQIFNRISSDSKSLKIFYSVTEQATFLTDFAQSVCFLQDSVFALKCLQWMCQVALRLAASLLPETVFFSTEIK